MHGFVIAAAPDLRAAASVLLRDLRAAGLTVDADLRGKSMKSQMRRADKSGAHLAFIVGQDEQARGVVVVRDMADKSQHEQPRAEVVAYARRVVEEAS